MLVTNHEDITKTLAQREQQLTVIENEIQQYRGAVSYSLHIQAQTKKALEQAYAAETAAKLAAESAAANGAPLPA